MTLVERIQKLCDGKNTTLIGLEREIGLGRGTIRKWDENSPSIDKLEKVADYFVVTTDYLLGRENLSNDLNNAYYRLMKTAQKKEIPAQDIEDAIMLLERARKRDGHLK